METLNFSISIHAPKEKIWKVLWDDSSYREWTSVFGEGSHAETDNWKEGSKVLFLGADGGGMVSEVKANKPNEFMSFKHLGMMKDGVEDTDSDEVKVWAGAMENYWLSESGGKTELKVEMDTASDFKDFFMKTWPQALEKVKTLSV
jgi:uncharacterized protein YndB with AHSA1/START domain